MSGLESTIFLIELKVYFIESPRYSRQETYWELDADGTDPKRM